jgi:hypothetical protein
MLYLIVACHEVSVQMFTDAIVPLVTRLGTGPATLNMHILITIFD